MPKIGSRTTRQAGGMLQGLLTMLGFFFLLTLLALLGAGWYAKKQIDHAGGPGAFSEKILLQSLQWIRPRIENSLTHSDRQRLQAALAQLQTSASGLNETQLTELNLALQSLMRNLQDGQLTEKEAGELVDALAHLTSPPSDVLDSESLPVTPRQPRR